MAFPADSRPGVLLGSTAPRPRPAADDGERWCGLLRRGCDLTYLRRYVLERFVG